MTNIDFGNWSPDLPELNNPCVDAKNVLPRAGGYSSLSSAANASNALGGSPLGLTQLGGLTLAGSAADLYSLSGGNWSSVGGSVYSAVAWHFALYGSRIIAADGNSTPQKFDIGVDSVFSDLAAAPAFNFPIVVRETLVGLGTPSDPQTVVFSASSDSEKWSADCGGGLQPIVDGGDIMGGVGGEFGLIFQRDGVVRMNFVGGDLRFTFDRIENGTGTLSGRSIVPYKGGAFYLSEDGFSFFEGGGSRSISNGRVAKTLFNEMAAGSEDQVSGAYDPVTGVVFWSVPVTGGYKFYMYSLPGDKFAYAEVDAHTLALIDGKISGFQGQVLRELSGSALAATLASGYIGGERKARVKRVKAMTDGTFTCSVDALDKLSDSPTSATENPNTNGYCEFRTNHFFHKFKVNLTGDWDEITGVEVEAAQGGRKN